MDFSLKTFYEQIIEYGKQLKDNRYGNMEVYEMQDGTRAYIMGKKRKKRSQASINKEWYDRYLTALKYYNIKVKALKKPTKKSVQRLKSQWQGINKRMKKAGYIDLPSVYQASAYIKKQEARPKNIEIPQAQQAEEPLSYSQLEQKADDAIQDLINTIKRMASNAGMYFKRRALDNIAESKSQAIKLLEYAKTKTDPIELAKALAENEFIERALEYEILDSESDNIGEFYDFITNELYDMINSAIQISLERV